MKKYIYLILFLGLIIYNNTFAQDNQTRQMTWITESWKLEKGEFGTLIGNFIKDWPLDQDAQQRAAMVRVKLENLTLEEAKQLEFVIIGNSHKVLKTLFDQWEAYHEMTIFLPINIEFDIKAVHPKYGETKPFKMNRLESEGTYSLTLKNNKTYTIVISSLPKGAKVYLDDSTSPSITPATIESVVPGEHRIRIKHEGLDNTYHIDVKEGVTNFGPYDLQKYKEIEILCDQSNAVIYIDQNKISQKTSTENPPKVKLTYGKHDIKIEIANENKSTERPIIIADSTNTKQTFKLVATKSIQVVPLYNGAPVAAELFVNQNKQTMTQNNSYNLNLKYNQTYRLKATYNNSSKEKTIKVRKSSPANIEIKIPSSNYASWNNQRNYHEESYGWSLNYVTKQWVMKGGGLKDKESAPWHKEDGRLHGVSLGWHYNPTFEWGGGLYTGIFWEYYFAKKRDSEFEVYNFDKFMEHVLHVPLHLSFRIPFSTDKAFSIHGGLGFDMGIAGSYYSRDFGIYYKGGEYYGKDNLMPERFNLSAEIGVRYRWDDFFINAEYSKGLTEHDYSKVLGEIVATQNKLSLGFGFVGDIFEGIADYYEDTDDPEDHSSIDFAWVSKQWATPNYPKPQRDNVYTFIGEESSTKRLHGFQIGYNYHPCSPIGVGLWTGLYWEMYFANCDNSSFEYPKYMESGIYIPLHLLYRIPFGTSSVSVHGGLGFDWTFYSEFYYENEYSSEHAQSLNFYGEDWGPSPCNLSGEIGASLRFGRLTLGAQYSRGFTKHSMGYEYSDGTEVETVQNKLTFTIGYAFAAPY